MAVTTTGVEADVVIDLRDPASPTRNGHQWPCPQYWGCDLDCICYLIEILDLIAAL